MIHNFEGKIKFKYAVLISILMKFYFTRSINLEDECWTMKMTMYFTIISRVILFSKEVFSQVRFLFKN